MGSRPFLTLSKNIKGGTNGMLLVQLGGLSEVIGIKTSKMYHFEQ